MTGMTQGRRWSAKGECSGAPGGGCGATALVQPWFSLLEVRFTRPRSERGADELQKRTDGQPDDVRVVAVDALDQPGPTLLDGVPAGPALPLARVDVAVDLGRGESTEGDIGRGEAFADREQDDARDDLVRAALQATERPGRVRRVPRLAEQLTVERDERVDTEDEAARGQARSDRDRLAPRVLEGDSPGHAGPELLDGRRPHLVGDAQLREDRGALRRGRGENEGLAAAADAAQSSGNQMPVSRAADSGESEPWTMLVVISIAKSPRIVPGVASSGLVAPMS